MTFFKRKTGNAVTNYSIKSEKKFNFLEIEDSNNIFYGGHQKWLLDKRNIINGCGPVAGANILSYLSKKNEKYENLYPYEDFSKESFSKFQRKIYDFIKPSVFGLVNINHFIKKILIYGKSRNIDLDFEKLTFNNKNFNYNSCYSFIRNAINRDLPVAAFNLDLRKKFIFKWHWIVITRIYIDENKNIKVVASSWGKRYDIEFMELFNSMKLGGGLVYFY